MAFWCCHSDAATDEHVHDFDEYFIVVEGSYILLINDEEITVNAGQEYYIPRGTRIAGKVTAGTRTIHVFGGKRATRFVGQSSANIIERSRLTTASTGRNCAPVILAIPVWLRIRAANNVVFLQFPSARQLLD